MVINYKLPYAKMRSLRETPTPNRCLMSPIMAAYSAHRAFKSIHRPKENPQVVMSCETRHWGFCFWPLMWVWFFPRSPLRVLYIITQKKCAKFHNVFRKCKPSATNITISRVKNYFIMSTCEIENGRFCLPKWVGRFF